MLQLVPFQCSMSVRSLDELAATPTAQMLPGPSAVTPVRKLRTCVPGAFGLGTMLQLDPSQCSTSVSVTFAPPTAQTSSDATAVTESSEESKPLGGTGTSDQLFPSQCSAKGVGWRPVVPSAHTSSGAIAETARRRSK